MALALTWNKERYLAFKEATNKAVRDKEEFFIFEGEVILTWFAYFFLQHLHARFGH